MSRHLALIARAVALIGVGATLIVGAVLAPQQEIRPTPVRSLKPATEQERREWDRQQLLDEMDRLREARH